MTLKAIVIRWKAWLLSFCRSNIASYSLAKARPQIEENLYDTGGFVSRLFVNQVGNLVGEVWWHVGCGDIKWHVGCGVGWM